VTGVESGTRNQSSRQPTPHPAISASNVIPWARICSTIGATFRANWSALAVNAARASAYASILHVVFLARRRTSLNGSIAPHSKRSITEWTGGRSKHEVRLLAEVGVPCAACHNTGEVLVDPHERNTGEGGRSLCRPACPGWPR
jgi:hypothetical protein